MVFDPAHLCVKTTISTWNLKFGPSWKIADVRIAYQAGTSQMHVLQAKGVSSCFRVIHTWSSKSQREAADE